MSKALNFGLRSLQLFADVGKFNAIGIVGNAILDICDAERDVAVYEAQKEAEAIAEKQMAKVSKKHRKEIERLKETALAKIREESAKTEYVMEQYRRDMTNLVRRLRRAEARES